VALEADELSNRSGSLEPYDAPSTTDAPAPTTTATTIPVARLSVTVRSAEGTPLGGVVVRMADRSTVTDESGVFTFESPTGGEVEISKPGWVGDTLVWDGGDLTITMILDRRIIRGLHVSGDTAGDDQAFAELLALARDTAVNALVFDTKQEGGTVLYETGVSEAYEIGAVTAAYDPSERIAQAQYADLYTITRIVTFEDRNRVNARPEEKLAGPWIDPRSRAAWDYNIALGVEACALGFDEIQYDYVRFPSGSTAAVSGQLNLTQDERVETIAGFLARAKATLEPMGCSLSAAIFGIVLATENDQGIGQRPEEISNETDAISPMVYPSHYSDGWIGLAVPNDHPYDVTSDALDDALERLSPGTTLRPWLQAFWWTNAQIRSSIQAAEDRGVGWMMWNVSSNFDRSALPTAAEVEG
jgi:hypothetical protein